MTKNPTPVVPQKLGLNPHGIAKKTTADVSKFGYLRPITLVEIVRIYGANVCFANCRLYDVITTHSTYLKTSIAHTEGL